MPIEFLGLLVIVFSRLVSCRPHIQATVRCKSVNSFHLITGHVPYQDFTFPITAFTRTYGRHQQVVLDTNPAMTHSRATRKLPLARSLSTLQRQ